MYNQDYKYNELPILEFELTVVSALLARYIIVVFVIVNIVYIM